MPQRNNWRHNKKAEPLNEKEKPFPAKLVHQVDLPEGLIPLLADREKTEEVK